MQREGKVKNICQQENGWFQRLYDCLRAYFIIIIYKMSNNQNPALSKCQMHCFSLKSLHKQRRINLNAGVTMCRSKQNKNKKNKNKCSNYEGPIFNKDRCHATPAFILPSEKTDYLASTRQFIRDHQKKVREYQQHQDELYIPKPRSKNMYCNVCRETYEEYLDHIRTSMHISNIRSSLFNNYILDVEKKFKRNQQREFTFNSNETGTPTLAEDEVEIIGSTGRKKIKEAEVLSNNGLGFPNLGAGSPANITGSTQSLYNQNQNLNYSFQMMNRLGQCRDFYNSPFNTLAYNPYLPFMQPHSFNFSMPMYCMPYQPMMTFQIFQNQL